MALAEDHAAAAPPEGSGGDTEVTPPHRRTGNYSAGQKARRERERGGASETATAPKAAKPRRKQPPLDQVKADIAKQLLGGHELAALFTGLDALRINEVEAAMLAGPFVDTCVELGIPLDGKLWAPLQLAIAMGMVYGPKFVAIRGQILAERARRARPADQPDMPPGAALNGELVIR